MLALSLVESLAFKMFVHTLDPRYTLPSRKHLSTKLLTEKQKAIQCRLIELLGSVECVSVTLDMWSNRQMKGYIGITCHFIKRWSMQTVLLSCQRFHGKHTAENITQYFDGTTTQYNLGDKISNIITDSASNMLKPFRLPGFESSTTDVDSNADTDSESDDDNNDHDEMEAVDLQESMTYLPEHDPCFAHTLQLVVKDGFKNAGAVDKVLAKVAKIVTFVRKSDARWNSELKSIRSILRILVEKLQQIECQQKLITYERSILKDLVEILTPFEEATDATQGQNVVSMHKRTTCFTRLPFNKIRV